MSILSQHMSMNDEHDLLKILGCDINDDNILECMIHTLLNQNDALHSIQEVVNKFDTDTESELIESLVSDILEIVNDVI